MPRWFVLGVLALVSLTQPLPTVRGVPAAQGRPRPSAGPNHVVEYDSNLAFTRLRFGSLRGGFGAGAWLHDYPAADRNLSAILGHMTRIRVHLEGTNVLELTDPRLFENPVLYVWEPGYWTIRAEEVEPLRQYLLKGGFVIFDDFEGPAHWANMTAQMRRASPDLQWQRIDVSHPIFHAFFNISNLDVPHPSVNVTPAYYALYEGNDPRRRMLALANHNNDIAEYWEWSVEGLYNPDPTNDAYRLGVNYFVYALTH